MIARLTSEIDHMERAIIEALRLQTGQLSGLRVARAARVGAVRGSELVCAVAGDVGTKAIIGAIDTQTKPGAFEPGVSDELTGAGAGL